MKRATPQPSTRTRVFVVKNSDAVATMAESSKIWRLSAFVLVVVVAAVLVVVTVAVGDMSPVGEGYS